MDKQEIMVAKVKEAKYLSAYDKRGSYYIYKLILDNGKEVELSGRKDPNIYPKDKIEFSGKDYGTYFEVHDFKILQRYRPPQRTLNDFKTKSSQS
jgi:hypothetical protein